MAKPFSEIRRHSVFSFQFSILKKLLPLALLCCWLSGGAHSAEKQFSISDANIPAPRVLVLPFKIYAPGKSEYLRAKVPEAIKNHLKREGAIVVNPAKTRRQLTSLRDIRKLGILSDADYVIWGSLTRVGQKFSLDAKMADSLGESPPTAFFVKGENIENLSATVKDLARNFGIKLFKREKVAQVRIAGNNRIETDAIRQKIRTKPGNVFLAKSLSQDLKAVYSMGYFDDIRIEAEKTPDGKIITFVLKEKPTIRLIKVKGNRVYEDKEIMETLDIKTGSILNIFKVRNNIERIESLYKDKNYHNVHVSYHVRSLDNNQADLEFTVEEGDKVRIKEIAFIGNQAYSDKELKKAMKSSEKGFWSWLTSSGEFNKADLEQDVARLNSFYHNNGYIQAKVGDPRIEYKENWIHITVKIDEGRQFKVGKVKVTGDLIQPEEELLRGLKISKETIYNREIVRNDVITLSDIYSDEGYAYADIKPRADQHQDTQTVDIIYEIAKGKQVYFEKIIITGNSKTRDKVLRRELKVHEQELYSGKRLKRSVRNLHRLDYFEDVKVDTLKGSADDKMVLKIDVTEKPTGAFSFGGGYSSVENVFAMASVTQRNLFGRGHILQLKAEVGGSTTRYTLSFTEPWLFDMPMSAGFDLYNWERDYDTYDKDSKGGGVRLGYRIFDYTYLSLGYSYEISDIVITDEDEVSNLVEDMEGEHTTSSVTTTLRYDSRDKAFNPTEGGEHSLTVEYAGLGGDIGFTKYVAEAGQYFPLFWKTVGFLHAKGGYVDALSGKILPDYERFYLGGMNSLRGFDWRDIALEDEDGDDIGGNQFVQFNVEFLFPLIEKAGVVGVLFYDTGNVYDTSENVDFGNLRQSAGFGFRWYSPMGPIRIENGYILDPKDDESKSGRWEFTMGTAF